MLFQEKNSLQICYKFLGPVLQGRGPEGGGIGWDRIYQFNLLFVFKPRKTTANDYTSDIIQNPFIIL